MRKSRLRRRIGAAFAVLGIALVAVPAAHAAVNPNEDPMWIFEPVPPEFPLFQPLLPPPVGYIDGPCGATVDSEGNFYISDYYHHVVDIWSGNTSYAYGENQPPPSGGEGYVTSLLEEDPVDGPCGLSLDGSNNLYVNNYHRNVVKFGPKSAFGSGTVIAGQGVDGTHSTGVDVDPVNEVVYVDARTYIAVYETDGTPVMSGAEPLHIGVGSLENGYGVAYSRYPGTLGNLYVPDAATNTIKIYDSTTGAELGEIDGSETPVGHFVSLRDASIAVDRVSGEIYVVDDLQPRYTEKPNAVVYVFNASGEYEGHLQNNVDDALPVGLAVDNSGAPRDPAGTQGRVYVTSGNTEPAVIYGYHADAVTTEPFTPAAYALKVSTEGTGSGSVRNSVSGQTCSGTCEEAVPGGSEVTLTAHPGNGSAFEGWAGACSGTDPSCTISVTEGTSARAQFDFVTGSEEGAQPSEPLPAGGAETASDPAATAAPKVARHRHERRHRRRHRQHRAHRRG
jgi:Divergent InlB B-repeat domain